MPLQHERVGAVSVPSSVLKDISVIHLFYGHNFSYFFDGFLEYKLLLRDTLRHKD